MTFALTRTTIINANKTSEYFFMIVPLGIFRLVTSSDCWCGNLEPGFYVHRALCSVRTR